MPENVNTTVLDIDLPNLDDQVADDREVMIDVSNVSMVFNMASESLGSLKEYFIKLVKHELFFEEFVALDNVSFQVKRGDVFGIMGTNGSGKSTMLKIIAGVLEPTKGTCKVNGGIAPLIELGAGFDTELSARENIYLNGALLGYSHDFIDEHFDEIVEFAEIEKFLDMPLKNYSSGMVSRIAFAIATVIVPDILLVDEVLSVGDFMFQRKCEKRITELIEKHGVTVLIVSHSNDQVARLCNKCIWIEKGHTRIQGEAGLVSSIYGALGGRVGSSESEQFIFDILKRQLLNPVPEERIESLVDPIPAANGVRASLSLARRGWTPTEIDTVVLAAGSSHIASVIVAPLARALDAPVLSWNFEDTNAEVLLYLKEVLPKRVIAVDLRSYTEVGSYDFSCLDWQPEIVNIQTGIMTELSKELLRLGDSLKVWGDAAVLIDFWDGSTLAYDAALYAASHGCPVLVRSDDAAAVGEFSTACKEAGLSKICVFGSSFTDEDYQVMTTNGLDVQKMDLDKDVREGMAAPTNPGTILVAASAESDWASLAGLPGYVLRTGIRYAFYDCTNLDMMRKAIEEVAKGVSSLQYLVSPNGLGGVDMKILAGCL